ncbi:transposase [Paenibacillus cremeus]|uniref:IS1595 family transposase n=1 Tax=Paenibacillus cremeus TaxID=2163881 RepID=A0A559K836_9BACL|nr:transposase [Paenibacillus cremeus]TVY08287.1 IS1595 family transposase [Paenibacillus cremeus]
MDEVINLANFHQQFGTEEACAAYLLRAKWPNGFSCPRCEHRHTYMTDTRRLPLFECCHCHHQTSLTAGTLLEGSRTELRKWFIAIFLVSRTTTGTSAVELSKIIRVTYKTAWLMLRKIRHGISTSDGGTLLSGIVQVNLAAYGHPHNPSFYKHKREQPYFIGSTVNNEGDAYYIKLKLIPLNHLNQRDVLRSGTKNFSDLHVNPQVSEVQFVTARYCSKRFTKLLLSAAKANEWINKTFHGIGRKHLQAYLDEYSYRYNLTIRKASIFENLVMLCASSSSLPYSKLTKAS